MKVPILKGRLLNWAYKLRSYDFDITYRRGAENAMADCLSRAYVADELSAQEGHIHILAKAMEDIHDNEAKCARILIQDQGPAKDSVDLRQLDNLT